MDLIEITSNQLRHPWEISRTKNLIKVCCASLKSIESVDICDIGAGDRYFDCQLLLQLKKEGIRASIHAVDNQYNELHLDSKEIQLHNDISTIKQNSMDLIIMMDVLEHIEDDYLFMQRVFQMLKKNGTLIITVPAFKVLFSSHDQFLKHFRRYERLELEKIITANKMNIEACHYFYFSLFIVRWLQVKLKMNQHNKTDVGIGMWKYSQESIRTRFIENVLNFDFMVNRLLNRFGIRLPGLSLVCIARKKLV